MIVDDDRWMREACKAVAEKLGFTVAVADSSVGALLHLAARPEEVVLINLRQPAQAALELLTRIKRLHPAAEVIMVALQEKGEVASTALSHGAFSCLRKPFQTDELKSLLEKVAGHLRTRRAENEHRNGNAAAALVGQSPEIQKLLRMVSKVASSRNPVLIVGESGTGKEKVARAIHSAGVFSNRPFVVVPCASPDPARIQGQLFSAENASGSTLFLDEVTAMPVNLQAKLVKALQGRQIRPEEMQLPADVRLIAATRQDLEVAVRQGTFRRDLYSRLNVVSLRVPPLRERVDDIPLVAAHILEHISSRAGRNYTLSPEAIKLLVSHHWPGNASELEGCLQRATALSLGGVVQPGDLPAYLQPDAPSIAQHGPALPAIVPLAEIERLTILNTLERLNGDKLTTARLLGIGKTTLYRKLREYGIAERWVSHPSGR